MWSFTLSRKKNKLPGRWLSSKNKPTWSVTLFQEQTHLINDSPPSTKLPDRWLSSKNKLTWSVTLLQEQTHLISDSPPWTSRPSQLLLIQYPTYLVSDCFPVPPTPTSRAFPLSCWTILTRRVICSTASRKNTSLISFGDCMFKSSRY